MAAGAPLRVLFITGASRSGSTLLESVLGQIDGVLAAGELHYAWDRGAAQNRPCACGEPFAACPVWGRAFGRAFPGGGGAAPRLLAARDRLTPARVVLRRLRGAPLDGDLGEYARRLGRLIESLAEVTGCRLLVDSSKFPGHGYLLGLLPNVDLRVLHLVRDPRAVCYSWRGRKVYDVSERGEEYLERHGTARTASLWLRWNAAAEILWGGRRSAAPYLRLRYEDLARRPEEALRRAAELAGEGSAALPFVRPATVRLRPHHAVAGNVTRFDTGVKEIRLDERWREGSRLLDLLALALTWPLAARYGYLRGERHAPRRAASPAGEPPPG